MKGSKNQSLFIEEKIDYNKEKKKKYLEEIKMNIENNIVKIYEVFDNLANLFKPLYNGTSSEETVSSMKAKSWSEPQQNNNIFKILKDRKSSFKVTKKNKIIIKNVVKTIKIYRIKRRKSINNNNKKDPFAWRLYIKIFNESLCLGPFIKKEIAEEVRNIFYKRIKNEGGLSSSNVLEFYEKFKFDIKNKRYAPIRMMRKRKYYKGTSRKV